MRLLVTGTAARLCALVRTAVTDTDGRMAKVLHIAAAAVVRHIADILAPTRIADSPRPPLYGASGVDGVAVLDEALGGRAYRAGGGGAHPDIVLIGSIITQALPRRSRGSSNGRRAATWMRAGRAGDARALEVLRGGRWAQRVDHAFEHRLVGSARLMALTAVRPGSFAERAHHQMRPG